MDNIKIIRKLKSLKLNLEVHPENEENSEFEDRINDLEEIINYLIFSNNEIFLQKSIIFKLERWKKRFEDIDTKANLQFIINEEKKSLNNYKKILKNEKKRSL